MPKTLIVLLIILALGLAVTSCASESGPTEARGGQQAPDFKLQNLDGQSVSLKEFKGKPVLINFWATWCGPCVYEMPFLQEIYDEWSGKGLVLLTINTGESPAKVSRFMQDHNLSMPVLLDAGQEVTQKYNITGVPTTFLIAKDGILQEKIIGAFPDKRAIEEKLSQIMQ